MIWNQLMPLEFVQMVSVEEDDLAGLEDVSSDGEDDNYEADMTDGETASSGTASGRKPYKKKARGIFSVYCIGLYANEMF